MTRKEAMEEALAEKELQELKAELDEEENDEEEDAEEVSVEDRLKEELEAVRTAMEDYKRKWYAVTAEYDNYRKRNSASTSVAYQDGKAEAITKLLPVADTFVYAYESASDEKTRAGIDKIVKNFNAILNSMGVGQIEVNIGDPFDETVMEAVMTLPCEAGEQPNTVKAILKNGYRREDKVIRFAQVCVTY